MDLSSINIFFSPIFIWLYGNDNFFLSKLGNVNFILFLTYLVVYLVVLKDILQNCALVHVVC